MSLHAKFALKRASFSLELALDAPAGQTVALVGPNGSGKSTLVEALAGLLPIDSGEIRLDGELLERPEDGIRVRPQQRPVGVLFQGLWLFPQLSVQDNVAYGPISTGMPRQAARAAVRYLLERLDLVDLAQRRPAELSGGEAQRVALARALAPRPRLLLLDEPLSALDIEARPRMRALLQEFLAEFPGPRLLITHEPLEALLLADHVVVLENGRVVQAGTTEELRCRPQTRYAATLSGVNLLSGTLRAAGSGWLLHTSGLLLSVLPEQPIIGAAVHATVHPAAVRLLEPDTQTGEGTSWTTHVESVELHGDRVRVRLADPPGFVAEPDLEDARRFGPGTAVRAWLPAKALSVYPRMAP
jgi:molybdate transport system ATP-binding protein